MLHESGYVISVLQSVVCTRQLYRPGHTPAVQTWPEMAGATGWLLGGLLRGARGAGGLEVTRGARGCSRHVAEATEQQVKLGNIRRVLQLTPNKNGTPVKCMGFCLLKVW